jgi:hypothetical protein
MRRYRRPNPASKTRVAARWLRANPDATPKIAGDLHGCTGGAVRTAWCRMFPDEPLRARLVRRAVAEFRAYLEQG